MRVVLAVDIGGTKFAAGRVDADGALLDQGVVPTPTTADGDAEHWFATLAALVDGVRRGDEVACGVGCGGPMTPGGEQVSPLKRNVTIEDVGNAAAFLCSDLAAGITGETLYVDAGYSHVGMSFPE